MLKLLVRSLVLSPVFHRANRLWSLNQEDPELSLSKFEKIYVGIYLILYDYLKGLFPPVFDDSIYQSEIQFSRDIKMNPEIIKPFWIGHTQYLEDFVKVYKLIGHYLQQGSLLELGAGKGWLGEMLANNFDVTLSTLSPFDVECINKRADALKIKGINHQLIGKVISMEEINFNCQYDGVYVYEALHHALDWRKALNNAYQSLRYGGYLFIFNEPNWVHTFSSYRVSKLTNTHEVGFKSWELLTYLRELGFKIVFQNVRFFFISPYWIVCQKSTKLSDD